MEMKEKMHFSGKLIGGIILILIGLLLLEDTLGFDFFGHIFPLLLIGLGIAHMIRRRNQDIKSSFDSHADKFKQKMNDAHSKIDDFDLNLGEKVNKFESKIGDFETNLDEKINKFESKIDDKVNDFEKKINETFNNNGKVKYEKTLGDLFVNCKGVNVQNVEVSSAIGDIEVQMRDAIYANGLNRLIISNFIGNVHIYIPKEISIFVNCSNFIGDIEAIGKRSTGFGNKVESSTTDYDTANHKLYIACNSFLGDIIIISV